MAKTKQCANCGADMSRKALTHVTMVGRHKVEDRNTVAFQCENCELADMSLEQLAKCERLAARTVLTEVPRVAGDVLKFARKALRLRQEELAALLDVAPKQVSRWETGAANISASEQLAVAELIDIVEREGDEALHDRLNRTEDERFSTLTVRAV